MSYLLSPRMNTFRGRLATLNWVLVALIAAISLIGVMMLYSVADGSFRPWSIHHAVRLIVGLVFMVAVAVMDIKIWFRLAYFVYIAGLAALLSVEFSGEQVMGARRWLDLGLLTVQPSEPMRIALMLALARYYHNLPPENTSRPQWLALPVLMIIVPAYLILKQPDLGTSILFALIGVTVLFLAGLNWRYFLAGGLVMIPAGWVVWTMLFDYQKQRVLTFLDPDRDPLGAGYHILQSKIAIGSGGLTGKGFMQGTQSQLNFLPEKHTDFIFTMFAEEMGLYGALGLLLMYFLVLLIGYFIARQARSAFGRILAMSVCVSFFVYLFVNIAMVVGLLPVVGVPLPLMSYGGTSMMTVLFGMGLLLNVQVNRYAELPVK